MRLSPDELEQRYRLMMPISIAWIKRLKELGVSVDALCEPELPAQAQVVMHGDRRFDFVNEVDGQPVSAMILLARDVDGAPCDLVAWEPRSNRMASLYGNAPLLGMEMLHGPRLDPENALEVFETVKDWLIAERHGVCIVHPPRSAPILRECEPLKVSSSAFGLRLRNLINPKRPRLFAPSAAVKKVSVK
jgi:hypothetical protein